MRMRRSARIPATEVAYENITSLEWSQRAFDLLQRGQLHVKIFNTDGVISAHVWGPCPRCGHDLDYRPTLSAIVPELGGSRGLWTALTGRSTLKGSSVPEAVDVGCGCGRDHPGAPKTVRGCGVSFRLPTSAPTAPSPTRVPHSPASRMSSP